MERELYSDKIIIVVYAQNDYPYPCSNQTLNAMLISSQIAFSIVKTKQRKGNKERQL